MSRSSSGMRQYIHGGKERLSQLRQSAEKAYQL
jgi:hypothetical protein